MFFWDESRFSALRFIGCWYMCIHANRNIKVLWLWIISLIGLSKFWHFCEIKNVFLDYREFCECLCLQEMVEFLYTLTKTLKFPPLLFFFIVCSSSKWAPSKFSNKVHLSFDVHLVSIEPKSTKLHSTASKSLCGMWVKLGWSDLVKAKIPRL